MVQAWGSGWQVFGSGFFKCYGKLCRFLTGYTWAATLLLLLILVHPRTPTFHHP